MDVILKKHVINVGRAGEVVSVKPGYARNYLIPQGLALPATKANQRRIEAEAKHRSVQLAAELGDAEALAAALENVSTTFHAKAGEGDKLFGSVTSADIADRLAELGFTVDKRHIELKEPLKMIGIHKVPIRLHPDVRAEVEVSVAKEE